MSPLRKLSLAAASAALMSLSTASQAALISAGTNNPYTFNWSFNTGSSLLTGNGSMTLSGFNTSLLSIAISLTNTSVLGGQGGERLVSFGFGIDPNAAAVGFADASDGGMVGASFAFGALPANVAGIEICAFGGPNCAGGGNGGIFGAGGSDAFTIQLAGSWGSSVNIDPLGFKYQTGYGSFEFPASPPDGGNPPSNVPEPHSTALLGLGLGLLTFMRRRKRAA